ncbi:hypothetical protein STEG23_002566, partial [Scotinomys teguina]
NTAVALCGPMVSCIALQPLHKVQLSCARLFLFSDASAIRTFPKCGFDSCRTPAVADQDLILHTELFPNTLKKNWCGPPVQLASVSLQEVWTAASSQESLHQTESMRNDTC